jgi:exodeoxyribonuclease VII small subunit
MSKSQENGLENVTYEQAFKELEEIVASLESNQQSLEESMRLYERGQVLSKYCTGLLEKAELKIQQLANITPASPENDR